MIRINSKSDSGWRYFVWFEISESDSQSESKTQKVRGEPGLNKKVPRANSPQPTRNYFYLLLRIFVGDLPCKRTCHGKGRMTKMLIQKLQTSSEALSSLTNISYIPSYSTHINSHISHPLHLLWSLPHRIHHRLIKPQTKLTDTTNLAAEIRSGNQELTNKQYYKGIQSN